MRREDIQPLLRETVDLLPEPDMADAAWAAGLTVRRRRRRIVVVSLLLVLVALLVVSISIEVGSNGKADLTPPIKLPTNLPGYVAPAGQISGVDFWIAPPPGSERFLERLETQLGDRLELPDKVHALSSNKLGSIAAVVLVKNGDAYEPLLLGHDSSWSQARSSW